MIKRIGHKLTAFHWRYNRAHDASSLAICTCGWRDKVLRKNLSDRRREAVCLIRGHIWGELEISEVGPVDFEDGEGEFSMSTVQCDRCYKVENLNAVIRDA